MLPEKIRELNRIFCRCGRQLYLVGGCVRDRLLDRRLTDYDLATDAPPHETKSLAQQAKPEALYTVGENYGTIGLLFGDTRIEITTFRSEEYQPRSRWPQVTFGDSLEEDLARRDFTINAIAEEIEGGTPRSIPISGSIGGTLIDPYGGLEDLKAKVIRSVGSPMDRFREDPLRLLRAVRFAAQLGFRIEDNTALAIEESASWLKDVSIERIGEETNKILLSPHPSVGIRLACSLGLMEYIIPEVLTMRGLSQEPWHHKDVFEHTMRVLDGTAPPILSGAPDPPILSEDLVLRWSALLHDIAKPKTRTVEEGGVHFFGHDTLGEGMARQILTRLRMDKATIARVVRLVRMHLRPNSYEPSWTDGAVRRLIRDAGADLHNLLALSRADVTSYRTEKVKAAISRVDELEKRCRELIAAEDVARIESPLDGHELMALFQRPPGPWIRGVKEHLLALVLDGELHGDDKAGAAELASAYLAQKEGETPDLSGETIVKTNT